MARHRADGQVVARGGPDQCLGHRHDDMGTVGEERSTTSFSEAPARAREGRWPSFPRSERLLLHSAEGPMHAKTAPGTGFPCRSAWLLSA